MLSKFNLLIIGFGNVTGEALISENGRAIRSGLRFPTKYLLQIIGWVAKRDLMRDRALSWDLF